MRPYTTTIEVTPQIAQSWLEQNQNNRPVKPQIVLRYAHDMAHGLWRKTHQGIAFYEGGNLADGQHRLWAIVKSGETIMMDVTYNLPLDSGTVIDQNASRTVLDSLRISGDNAWYADKEVIAMCRVLILAGKSSLRGVSPDEIRDYAVMYEPHVRAVRTLFTTKRRGVSNSALLASIFLAHYAGVSIETLRRFHEILVTGFIDGPHEGAAIRLREYLSNNTGVWTTQLRWPTMKRAMRAIQAFNDRQPIDKLYLPQDFIYPFPQLTEAVR